MPSQKVLLIYPLLNRTKGERDYHWFPFSVLPIAKSLRELNLEPIVVDRRVEPESIETIKGHLQDSLMVGISALSGYQITDGLHVAKIIRGLRPDVPIVWGGWHSTILPEETAQDSCVDVAVAGRGEDAIKDIARSYLGAKGLGSIKGIAFSDDKEVRFTGYRETKQFVDDVRGYDDFIDVKRYINPKTMAIGYFSGHGCSFKCGFCSRHFMTNKYSPKPIERVMDELAYYITKYGFKHIHFQDDNLFLDIRRVIELSKAIVNADHDVSWWANVR
ncbi:unnamed protein product, partial [marine sediment metagenome]